jgi:hypothetical protein
MILEIGAAWYRNPLNYTENDSVPRNFLILVTVYIMTLRTHNIPVEQVIYLYRLQ